MNSGYGSGQAQAKVPNSTQAVAISPLVQAANDIRDGIARIYRARITLDETAGRLFGYPAPSDSMTAQVDTPPSGFVEDLIRAIQEMHKAIDGLEEQVTRVSRI